MKLLAERPGFMKAPMKKRFRMLLWIARSEYKMVSIFTICEIIFLVTNISLTILLLAYFSSVPAFVPKFDALSFVFDNKRVAILLCVVMASVSLFVKLGQGIIDARVMSNREFWYAEFIRKLPENSEISKIPNREISRGSHYYGRLASSVLQISASGFVFVLTYLLCLMFLAPTAIAITIIATIIIILFACILGLSIARKLKLSATGLVERASSVALWKGDSATQTNESIFSYYNMYFYRIFLVGVFGYSNLLFAVAFTTLLLINEYMGFVEVTFESIIIVYFIAQMYLGNFAKFVTNVVKTAAFLPFVEPVMDV